jgi:hypothetical protein
MRFLLAAGFLPVSGIDQRLHARVGLACGNQKYCRPGSQLPGREPSSLPARPVV